MYEFLAPWGVLVPALSALVIYLRITATRRKGMMKMIHAPNEKCCRVVTRITRSRTVTRVLSRLA
ncbi:MAG: hypothetical protein OIF48_09415 [Silicimonas sp.]|nr:hypothetical protein [Silicimonas sp.]